MRSNWSCDDCVVLLLKDELWYDRKLGIVLCKECWEDRNGQEPQPEALLCVDCGAPMRGDELLGSSGWHGTREEPMFCNRCTSSVSDEYVEQAVERLNRLVDNE